MPGRIDAGVIFLGYGRPTRTSACGMAEIIIASDYGLCSVGAQNSWRLVDWTLNFLIVGEFYHFSQQVDDAPIFHNFRRLISLAYRPLLQNIGQSITRKAIRAIRW